MVCFHHQLVIVTSYYFLILINSHTIDRHTSIQMIHSTCSYLLPDKSKKTKQKTAVVKKSLNPKWNYQYVYDNVSHEELMDRVLELTVWDFDRGSSNEFLGGVRLGLGTGLTQWDDATSEEQAAWNKMLNNQNNWNEVTLTLREHMGSNK